MLDFDPRAAAALPAGEHLTFPDHPGLRFVAGAASRAWIYRYKSPVDGRIVGTDSATASAAAASSR